MKKPEAQRLQKLLANAGLGSRRQIETWIREGRVEVNGRKATLGDRATLQDRISVDGRAVSERRLVSQDRYVILYNKPEGEVVTRSDPEGRRTVFQSLPRLPQGRWIAVGRLDVNSSGLLLFTNDGELANRLMHPKQLIEREYAVRVHGEVTDAMLRQLVRGVELEDGPARFEEVVFSGGEGANRWYHVVLMEGRKREVRRMWESVGVVVNRLKRVRFGPLILDSKVKSGMWRELDRTEKKELLRIAGMKEDKTWGTLNRPGARSNRKQAGFSRKRRH